MRTLGNRAVDADDPRSPAQLPGGAPAAPAVEASAVRAQLERILASPPFRNSKRYPALLRYVVEQELSGASSELKERTIAIDVFGRDPFYDPSVDPVVRISAGEVRKRLAQYYQEVADANEVRIELPVGSYHPEFVAPMPAPAVPPQLPASPDLAAATVTPAKDQTTALTRRYWAAVFACATVAVLVLGLVWLRLANRPTALDLFWRPVIAQNHAVMLCLGRGDFLRQDSPASSHAIDPNQRAVPWWDAETLARLAGLIQSKGASLRLFREDQATFSDFQQSPSVLIGAYNDQWTLELMSHMRYTFQKNGNLQWIADRENPSLQNWKIDLNQKDAQGYLAIKQDYAIISRVANPRTGFITVTVAGLWGYGTLAAGRFLTDPQYLAEYKKRTGFDPGKGNIQLVIGTEVIQGRTGPPQVLAAATW